MVITCFWHPTSSELTWILFAVDAKARQYTQKVSRLTVSWEANGPPVGYEKTPLNLSFFL
jgi:hypothetical protein